MIFKYKILYNDVLRIINLSLETCFFTFFLITSYFHIFIFVFSTKYTCISIIFIFLILGQQPNII
jgi:p-aminobenzoyl-glutamate transporter AbgT